jgi:hypothetical protein
MCRSFRFRGLSRRVINGQRRTIGFGLGGGHGLRCRFALAAHYDDADNDADHHEHDDADDAGDKNRLVIRRWAAALASARSIVIVARDARGRTRGRLADRGCLCLCRQGRAQGRFARDGHFRWGGRRRRGRRHRDAEYQLATRATHLSARWKFFRGARSYTTPWANKFNCHEPPMKEMGRALNNASVGSISNR